MTDFEKTIKRGIKCGITREKFEKIRDHHYFDGSKDILDLTYGDVSSWLTWNRENGKIISDPNYPDKIFIQRGDKYDGPINEWKEWFSEKLTTDIVFLGLNMSGEGVMPKGSPKFQNARGCKRIVDAFFSTEAEGSYFTDIIKPDQRIIDYAKKNEERMSNSQMIKQYFKGKENGDILEEHINIFKKELEIIEAENPLLIVFGGVAEWILKKGIKNEYLKKGEDFRENVKIYHYSSSTRGTDENYRKVIRDKLKDYITIPEETLLK